MVGGAVGQYFPQTQLTILKVFALAYRGAGRTKYAHELLSLIHSITHVWPKSLRYVVPLAFDVLLTLLLL